MSTSNGFTEINGVFDSVADLLKYGGKDGSTVAVNSGANTQWYKIASVDTGGTLLDSGLFANAVSGKYDNAASGLTADDMQAAIDEVVSMLGKSWVTKFASEVIQIPGSTTTAITIPCPAGQRIVLTMLGAQATKQTNTTTVSVGGAAVLTAVTLAGVAQSPALSGECVVGGTTPSHPYVIGDVDEDFVISFGSSTSSVGVYSYQFEGEGA